MASCRERLWVAGRLRNALCSPNRERCQRLVPWSSSGSRPRAAGGSQVSRAATAIAGRQVERHSTSPRSGSGDLLIESEPFGQPLGLARPLAVVGGRPSDLISNARRNEAEQRRPLTDGRLDHRVPVLKRRRCSPSKLVGAVGAHPCVGVATTAEGRTFRGGDGFRQYLSEIDDAFEPWEAPVAKSGRSPLSPLVA
jgi:hypothetical protein